MSTVKGEQARRIPFNSPLTNLAISSRESSPRSLTRTKETRREAVSTVATNSSNATIPTLNVITDFDAPKKSPSHQRDLSIQERRQQAKKTSNHQSSETLQSNPVSALSPSDRTLMIGFSLQPESVEHQNNRLTIRNSVAPEIVFTPADDSLDPWETERGRRPRSSVYSQATRISQIGATISRSAPPVPPLPGQANKFRPTSAVSWHTDFSDDNEREEICRRYSGESQLGIIRNTSVHTTRRRSEGWWNTILSPIFGRTNTVLRKEEPMPKLSEKALAARDFLTVDPMASNKSRRSSVWTDLSRLDAQRRTLAFFNDSPTDVKAIPVINNTVLSPELVQEAGFGFASEYYEACWHDAYSSTPFYECQGHDCKPKATYRHGKVIGGPDATHENGLTEKNLASLSGPSSVTSTSIQGPSLSHITSSGSTTPQLAHIRNNSNGTEIDEEPDAGSIFHESHSKTSSVTGFPMPTTSDRFQDKVRTLTDQTSSTRVFTAERVAIRGPTKALRIMGLDERPTIAEPKKSEPSETRSVSDVVLSSSQQKVVCDLEDPFRDMPYCFSPEVLTPGMQKEFAKNNAIPMPTMRPTSMPTIDEKAVPRQHDPLDIAEPRKAPLPPRMTSPSNSARSSARRPMPAFVPAYDRPSRHSYHESFSTTHPYSNQSKSISAQQDAARALTMDFASPPNNSKKLAREKVTKEKDTSGGSSGLISCIKRKRAQPTKKRKRWYCLIGCAMIGLIILILVLILTFTLHRSDTPVQTSWLNITGFPPIPTGIATIAQPNAAIEESSCVAPNTLWSCAVPKEEQASIAPNAPDQPNFRLEIRFQNGSSALNASNIINSRSVGKAAGAGKVLRERILQARDSFTSSLFNPSPSPPNQEDQIFLGNTTDNNTAPFQGEATPFFISFLPTTAVNSKRAILSRDNDNPFPNVTAGIPAPSSNSDGTAAPANLSPFPTAQPIMLYNRGRDDEHYGFYTYFDRSIFLKSTDLLNSTGPDIPDNANGGVTESAADVRCTWAQTRFLVQIWTNSGSALQLIGNTTSLGSIASSTSPSSSSATNFIQPGSFPYPVSITLDRHGGDDKQKMIYCYGMDEANHLIASQKQIHLENRAVGGLGLINPGGSLFGESVNVGLEEGGPGGIDGGFGGCKCQWRNWIQS